MSDYKAEVERIVPRHSCCPTMQDDVIAALEAAEKRGREIERAFIEERLSNDACPNAGDPDAHPCVFCDFGTRRITQGRQLEAARGDAE